MTRQESLSHVHSLCHHFNLSCPPISYLRLTITFTDTLKRKSPDSCSSSGNDKDQNDIIAWESHEKCSFYCWILPPQMLHHNLSTHAADGIWMNICLCEQAVRARKPWCCRCTWSSEIRHFSYTTAPSPWALTKLLIILASQKLCVHVYLQTGAIIPRICCSSSLHNHRVSHTQGQKDNFPGCLPNLVRYV